MSVALPVAGAARVRPAGGPRAWRLLTAVPAVALAALQWGQLVRPAAPEAMLVALAGGAGLGWALLTVEARSSGRHRAGWCAGVVLLAVPIALLAAGIAPRDLLPDRWGALASGLGDGVAQVPDLLVPYQGAVRWTRHTILLGGTALTIAVLLLACWPSRGDERATRAMAAAGTAVLYVAAVIAHTPRLPFLTGALFAVAMLVLVRAERIPRERWRSGLALAAAAVVLAVVLAPRLDAARPLIDLQHLGDRTRASAETFSWNHRYGPLDWPRTGKKMLTLTAPTAAYWKAATLDRFDGLAWREDPGVIFRGPDTEIDRTRPDWMRTVTVQVGDLRTDRFVAPGTLLQVRRSDRPAIPAGPGVFETGGNPLRAGDSYQARSYVPRPSAARLAASGTDYPALVDPDLLVELPRSVGGPTVRDSLTGRRVDAQAQVAMPAFGNPGAPVAVMPGQGGRTRFGGMLLRRSNYARVYRLAQRLRASVSTPYAFVLAVQRRVQQGAVYSETPGTHRTPLDAFLFEDRQGYCQHFSGAMALLLRLGGVPARVAAGFAPGTPAGDHTFTVRDSDAHSWVEVYFPRTGWVTFDPTPSASPARSQAGDRPGDGAGGARAARAAPAPATGGPGDGVRWTAVVELAAAVLLLLLLAVVALRARRRRRGAGGDPTLDDLERALRRSGRAPRTGTTLRGLEPLLDDAAPYVRAVREQRYGGASTGPTAAQRRALRRALGRGLGLRGRLRAWWAVPPRRRRRDGGVAA